MAKIKNIIGNENKLKQYRSTVNTTKKSKASRNRGKTLGAILSTTLKSSKNVHNDVHLIKPVMRSLLTEKKPIEVAPRRIASLQKFNTEENNDKISHMKGKKMLDSKTTPEEKYDNNEDVSKTEKKIKETKYTPKIKKTTTFKSKTPKLKVKTVLMFNQKLKKENENNEVNLDDDTIKSGIKALFNIIEESRNNKTLFEDELPIFLQFSSIKIGKTPSRTLRIPLKHSLVMDSSEVCLITDDIKTHNQKEYEKTVEYYETLLKEKNVTNIKTVMPYYQLRTDYSEFELKRKLVELYDIFLVDAKLSGYVVKKLGKIFRDKRKLPIPIRLNANNLKEQINFALSKTSTNLHPHGDNFIIQIAHSNMTEKQIYENIIESCTNLAKQFPGGWFNIKGLNLKTAKSVSIPIYYTMTNPSKLPVPVVKAKRPKAFKAVTDELSTVYDKNVTVLPFGKVILHNNQDQTKLNRKQKIKQGKSNSSEENMNISEKNNEFQKSKRKKPKPKVIDIKIKNSSKHNLKIKMRPLNAKLNVKKAKTSLKSKEKKIKKQILNQGKKGNITKSKKLKVKNK